MWTALLTHPAQASFSCIPPSNGICLIFSTPYRPPTSFPPPPPPPHLVPWPPLKQAQPSNAPSHCQQSQHARLLTLLAAACASTAARALATLLAAPDIREHGLQGGSGKGRCGVDGRWPWLLLMLAFLVTSMTMPMAMGQCCLLQCSTEEVVA